MGKMNEKGGAGYETTVCFMELDVSEKYQSKIHRLEHQEAAHSP
jgi:hypothetical protein